MTEPPPADLMQWSKPALVRELHRLRAISREHAEHIRSDSRRENPAQPPAVSIDGDPHGRGNVVLDMRGAVLLDYTEVVLIDRDPSQPEPPAMLLSLAGRVNFSTDRSQTAYVFGTDGAAAIISEITGLAARAGGDFGAAFQADLDRRLKGMP